MSIELQKTINVYGVDGKPIKTIKIPDFFFTEFRPDLIKRVCVILQSHCFQPKGRDPMAGKRTTAESLGVGHGLARVPRVKGERYPKAGAAAFAPNTVGGRLAHPPTPEKKIYKRINEKEKRLALFSAIAATALKEIVVGRGHRVDSIPSFPLIVSDQIQTIKKASDFKRFLINIGVWEDVERVIASVKIRAGKGKRRGRVIKHAIGPLIVINEDKGVAKAAQNFLGIDVIKAKDLNVRLLAPGTHPGRLTVWTESAIKTLDQIFSSKIKEIQQIVTLR
ncbi:MAG: 50S ribosomal protein L4 [Candidatus Bathyarchaeia archaeon]